MKNITNNYNQTIFLDLDGTLVIHNYDPENVEDIFIGTVLDYAVKEYKKGSTLVLTTARRKEHCIKVLSHLEEAGMVFHSCLFDLPAGRRVLINDKKSDGENKAIAINLSRNCGF